MELGLGIRTRELGLGLRLRVGVMVFYYPTILLLVIFDFGECGLIIILYSLGGWMGYRFHCLQIL